MQNEEENLYRKEVYDLVNRMRGELAIRDRKVREIVRNPFGLCFVAAFCCNSRATASHALQQVQMKLHRKTFVGTEAVEWICSRAPITILQVRTAL